MSEFGEPAPDIGSELSAPSGNSGDLTKEIPVNTGSCPVPGGDVGKD